MWYEYKYDNETGDPVGFGVQGVSDAVAKAIRAALRKLETQAVISNVNVERISETREAVTGADPV